MVLTLAPAFPYLVLSASACSIAKRTPLQWFMDLYPELTRDDARKWLGR